MTPPRALELMAEIDRRVDVPLIPMTYGAIVESYGREAVLPRRRQRPAPRA